jgi:hypothetical protein
MNERPILFSAPMVRALLAGTKTQTRRAVRKQFAPDAVVAEVGATTPEGWQVSGHSGLWWDDAGACLDDAVRCPYGMPGDRLWVRESFSGARAYETHGYPLKDWGNKIWFWADGNPQRGDWTRPRPSIHMPRHLSRILLEVTAIHVERLQDISAEDATAEGVDFAGHSPEILRDYSPDERFSMLWETINGDGSWNSNPWVWVVEFKRVTS